MLPAFDLRDYLLKQQQGAAPVTGAIDGAALPDPSAQGAPPPAPTTAPATPDMGGLYEHLLTRYGLSSNPGADIDKAIQGDNALRQGANLAKTGEVMMASMQRRAPNVAQYDAEPFNLKNLMLRRQLAQEDLQREQMLRMMPLEVAGKVAGINKSNAEAEAAHESAVRQSKELQTQRDLKQQEIEAAARQGDLNRANALLVEQKRIDAEIEARRRAIAAENPENADLELDPRYRGGDKKADEMVKGALAKTQPMRATLDASTRLREILDRNPNGVSRGDDAAEAQRWLGEIKTNVNNVWGMGVFKQSNAPMLEEAIADPTKLSSRAWMVVKGQDFRKQLGDFDRMVKQRVMSEANATGVLHARKGGYLEKFQGATGSAGGSPDDAAALQWAKSHPNDPRAAKILQHLGANDG